MKFRKQRNIISTALSTIWENTDGCTNNYRCVTEFYLMSMLTQKFYVIIDGGISALVHGREVLYGLNSIVKRFLFQLISTVKLTGDKRQCC